MSKDKIEVNMNVYDIPIVVEALEEANKEIERLDNIINELEKELKDRIKNVPDTMAEVYEDKSILHKLQELKGSDSNVKD